MVNRREDLLGYPKADPYGDPISDKNENLPDLDTRPLSNAELGKSYILKSLGSDTSAFLQQLDKKGLSLNQELTVLEREEFDGSVKLLIDDNEEVYLSERVAKDLFVC